MEACCATCRPVRDNVALWEKEKKKKKKKTQQQLDQWPEPDCGNYKSHDPATLTIPLLHQPPPPSLSPPPLSYTCSTKCWKLQMRRWWIITSWKYILCKNCNHFGNLDGFWWKSNPNNNSFSVEKCNFPTLNILIWSNFRAGASSFCIISQTESEASRLWVSADIWPPVVSQLQPHQPCFCVRENLQLGITVWPWAKGHLNIMRCVKILRLCPIYYL